MVTMMLQMLAYDACACLTLCKATKNLRQCLGTQAGTPHVRFSILQGL